MSDTPDPAAPAPPPYALVSGLAAFASEVIAMVASAHTELNLFSYALDYRIYGSEEFSDTLKTFILQHRRARLRAIVHSPALAMRRGHRLVELGRMLSSRIEFRQLPEERQKQREEYLLVDERALIFKEDHADMNARRYSHDPLRAREQLRSFENLWSECAPAREFTDLKL